MRIKFKSFLVATASLLLAGCTYNLVPEPTSSGVTTKNPADYADYIVAPASITASNGGYRSVDLSWSGIENAVQYVVYSAETPFDTFEQIYKTIGKETTYTVEEEPGITRYYAVAAVNYYGTVSPKSKVAKGTTLSIPIITDVHATSEGSSLIINWWMDNCSPSTYQDNLGFSVTIYDEKDNELKDKAINIEDGSARMAEIFGLSSNTDYRFQIDAYIKDSSQKSEKSDKTSASTAHRIIPDSPVDFQVSQGTSKDFVELSWKLPSPVDSYDSTTMLYSTKPVYFVVYRKNYGAPDSAYTQLAKIGTGVSGTSAITFDCSAGTTSSPDLDIQVFAEGKSPEDCLSYISLSTLTYRDTTAERGKQYTYMVQSYTDNSAKVYTSDTAKTESFTGWRIANIEFNAASNFDYDEEDPTKIKNVTTVFNLNFQPYTASYAYVLTSSRAPLETEIYGEEQFVYASTAKSDISNFILNFSNPESESGYYKFFFYLADMTQTTSGAVPSACLDRVEAAQRITVTADANAIPVISNFKVMDGYKDKFLLTWDEIEGAEYTVSYIPVMNGADQPMVTVPLQNTDSSLDGYYTVKDSKVTFSHDAVSGDCRKYTLTANTGLSTSESKIDEDGLEITYKTLGKADVVPENPDYSKIRVCWDEVQMADSGIASYSVSAKYQGSPVELTNNENTSITFDEETSTFICEIEKPSGFNDPKVSGKPITLTVNSSNSVTGDVSSTEVTVRTMGPALINAETKEMPDSGNSLSLTWNQVEGAESYLVFRSVYTDGKATAIASTDAYLVSATGSDLNNLEITEVNGQEVGDRAKVKLQTGKYTLTDRQKNADEGYGYQANQEKIAWGLPYGYVVIPVKAGGSAKDFSFESNSLKVNASSAVDYGTLKDVKTATYGYGLNVRASKATNASKVKIEWDAPYYKNFTPTLYRKSMYTKDPSTSEWIPDTNAVWEMLDPIGNNLFSYEVEIAPKDIGNAYQYAVQYQSGATSSFVDSFTNKLNSTKDSRYIYPDGVEAEQANKGYVLALEDFSAAYGGHGTDSTNSSYYQENVTWTPWNYTVRALGPDSFSISIRNLNLSNDWNSVADANIIEGSQNITTRKDIFDTNVEKLANGISLKPAGLTAGTASETDGVLKVLRIAKHFYSANLKAAHTGNEFETNQADNNSVYTYRQISEQELVKMVNLIVADALYQAGIPTNGTTAMWDKNPDTRTLNPNGTFSISHIPWDNYVYYSFTNYRHSFKAGLSSSYLVDTESEFTLTSNESSKKKGLKANTVYYLPQVTINVKHDSGLSTYNSNLNFMAGAEGTSQVWNLTVSKTDSSTPIVNISGNKDKFLSWFPYEIGSKHTSGDATVNSALKTYSAGWWY